MTQSGANIIIKATTNPRGFIKIDPKKSPLANEMTDLVEPHDGQGTPVTCFIKHTSIELLSE
ncbi:hypothetical protein GIHI108528_00615 [Gillisia hiemivivida]|nr:hypothetical protein [Gillisia hiemivivida]